LTTYLDEEEILLVSEIACGFPPRIREHNQFKANVSRPSTTIFGDDAYPTAWDKAAALLHSFCTTQSLLDGNKRTGWAACWLFLRLNLAVGPLLGEVDADAAERLVLKIANEKIEISEIADTLRSLVTPLLGNVGHLPPGFEVTNVLEDLEGVLTGIGELPDGTRLVYMYFTSDEGTPVETVLTPSQAREFAEELLRLADNPLEQRKQLRFQVQAIQAHLDLHNRPGEL